MGWDPDIAAISVAVGVYDTLPDEREDSGKESDGSGGLVACATTERGCDRPAAVEIPMFETVLLMPVVGAQRVVAL